jgi:hypothetical protein
MRGWYPAFCILILAAAGAAPAQQAWAQQQQPPAAEPQAQPQPQAPGVESPAAPPPLVLLPPGAPLIAPEAPAASDTPAPKPVEPPKRPRRVAAIIQALDKTTAETLRFEAPINQPIRYKDLVFVVHVCEDSAPDQGQRGAAAHMEIISQPKPVAGRITPPTRQLFKGWMFASAPGLHPFEHPVYDAWLIGCRQSTLP